MELTKKQKKLLLYIIDYKHQHQETPTLRQCAADIGVTHAAIAQLIKTLEQKGAIKRHGKYGRSISVNKEIEHEQKRNFTAVSIPIIGDIAAGLPLYAQQAWAGSICVDAEQFQGANLFALTIKGDSMKDAAILDGDLVICKPRQFAENGEIIVALVHNEEATVKRFFKQKNTIELRPENESYKSKQYGFDDVLIQGKVVGVIRTY